MTKSVGVIEELIVAIGCLQLGRRMKSTVFVLLLAATPIVYMGLRIPPDLVGPIAGRPLRTNVRRGRSRSRSRSAWIARTPCSRRPCNSLSWDGADTAATGSTANSVTDGYWVIVMGTLGYVGLSAWSSYSLLPVLRLLAHHPVREWGDPRIAIAGSVALVQVMYFIDCLSNAMINPIYCLACGGLVSFRPGPLVSRTPAARSYERGEELSASGDLRAAVPAYREAIGHYQAILIEEPYDRGVKVALASCHDTMADRLLAQGEFEDALATLRSSVALWHELALESPEVPACHDSLASALETLARALASADHFQEAEDAWTASMEARRQAAANFPDDPGVAGLWAENLNNFAWFLSRKPGRNEGDLAHALDMASQAVAISPQSGTFWNTLGTLHYQAGENAAAVAALHEAATLNAAESASTSLLSPWPTGASASTPRPPTVTTAPSP